MGVTLSALEQAALVKKREASRVELLKAHLDRVLALNPKLWAFTDLRARRAVAEARALDAIKAPPRSVLDGAVTAIKDLNMVRGTFTRLGTKQMRYFIAPIDDDITKRLRNAGMQLLGKLATSELGAAPVTEPLIHPPTSNPYDLSHNAGGSSGGSGSAVGAGLLALAHGSDGAGSIRIPAAFCGVFGFKPTQSLVPSPIGKIDVNDLTANGPLASNVPDLAAMVDVLARLTHDSALLPRLDHVADKPRIYVTYDSPLGATDPAIKEAVKNTARILETLGYRIEERPWMPGSAEEFLPIWQRLSADVPLPADYGMMPMTKWLREHGRLVTHTHSARRKRELEGRVNEWWDDAELWLSPTVPMFAPKNGGFSSLSAPQMFFALAAIGAFTAVFNLSGQPSGSVPAGYGPNGLPIGVQITGRRGDDLRVLQLMRVLERELAPLRATRSPAVS